MPRGSCRDGRLSSAKALHSETFLGCLQRAVESMWISAARSRPVRANERATELSRPQAVSWLGLSGSIA
eukprot:7384958-Prymnesium_polylepis.1